MSEIIPQNLLQCTFDFDAPDAQPFEQVTYIAESQDTPLRRCVRCKEILPATKEYFHANKSKKGGLTPECKECIRFLCESRKTGDPLPGQTKRCAKCKQHKPATKEFFYSHSRKHDGLTPRCKDCSRPPHVEKDSESIPEGQKQCTKCKKILPATKEFFFCSKHQKSGLTPQCKGCQFLLRKQHVHHDPLPGEKKQCYTCKVEFPATTEFFHSDKSKTDGLTPYCKGCKSASRKQEAAHRKPVNLPAGTMKQCIKCNEAFPATNTYFANNRYSKDGLRSYCKRCQGNSAHGIEPVQKGQKRCSKCKEIFPATNAYFVVDKRHSDGLYSSCKKCNGRKTHGIEPFKRGIRESEKQCTKCKLWKPFDDFGVTKFNSSHLTAECKECHNKHATRTRKSERARTKWLQSKYGITIDQYNFMFEEQGGACFVCKKPETAIDPKTGRVRPLAVDHDHKSGEVRALLCGICNTTLGKLDEDPERIRALADYAEWSDTPHG